LVVPGSHAAGEEGGLAEGSTIMDNFDHAEELTRIRRRASALTDALDGAFGINPDAQQEGLLQLADDLLRSIERAEAEFAKAQKPGLRVA
jgi:hypothetical protein